MLIRKVQIRDIKNYTEKDFDFSAGVTAICGPNGAGKTTIIESIAWTLFDHLDYKREDFVRKGARKGSVNVSFVSQIDGREYAVFRDSTGTYYVYDPELNIRLAQQKQEVLKWLCQQHGVEPDTDLSNLFRTTIGVPQGTFTYDFLQPPSKRKPIFDKILKVEEYLQASDELKDLLKFIDKQIAAIREQIASDEGELKRYDEIEFEHNQITQALALLKLQYKDAELEKTTVQMRLEQLDGIKENFDLITKQLHDTKISIADNLAKEKSLINDIARAKQAAELLDKSKTGYETYLSTTQKLKELEKQRTSRDQLRVAYSTTQQQLARLESRIQSLQESLTQIEKARAELVTIVPKIAEQDLLEKKLKEFQRKLGEKEQIERNISKIDKELEDLRQKYTETSRGIEESEKFKGSAQEVSQLETEKKLLEDLLNKQTLALTEIKHKQEQLSTLESNFQKLQREGKILSSRIAELQNDTLLKLPPIQDLEATYREMTTKAAEIRATIQHDEKMQQEIKNGLCPLLSQRCLNMKEGQTLDQYFQSQLTDHTTRLSDTESQLKTISFQLTQGRLALGQKATLESLLLQQENLKRDENNSQKQLTQLNQELASLGSNEQVLEAKRANNIKLQLLENELLAARQAMMKYNQVEPLRQYLRELKEEGVQKRKANDIDKARLVVLKEELAEQANIESQLLSLGNPRATYDSLNRQIVREVQLREELNQNEQTYQKLTSETAHLKADLDSLSNLDSELNSTNIVLGNSQSDYNNFIVNQPIALSLPTLEAELTKLLAENTTTRKTLETLETEYILISSKYSHEEHSLKRNQLNKLVDQTSQLKTELKHSEAQLELLTNQLNRLAEVKQRQADKIANRDRLTQLHELADFIRECLRKAGPYITEVYLHTISLEANQLYQEISGNSLVNLRWDKEYEIVLEEEGRDRPFHNLSGGEQMTAALSVRLALLKEFSDLRFAFFDEPTTNMDEERRLNLAQQIGSIKNFEQLFIVTHDDSFEGFTDNIIQLKKAHH